MADTSCTLCASDVEHLLDLASRASDPQREVSLSQRKLDLFEGIGRTIGANAWVWLVEKSSGNGACQTRTSSVLDAGWKDEDERSAALRLLEHPAMRSLLGIVLDESIARMQCVTVSGADIVNGAPWQTSPACRALRLAGFDHFLCSIKPLGDGSNSCVRFFRRLGAPGFSERERSLVEMGFAHIPWLHASRSEEAVSNGLATLSPRERQVLSLLLAGDSRKQVARKLTLSEHTVADYLKAIYRKLDVCSRGELLAKYIRALSE